MKEFIEINGQMFSPEELKLYIKELKSENEYLDAKVRYLSERALTSAVGAEVEIFIRKDPCNPDRKALSIGFVYDRRKGPKQAIGWSGLKDVTVNRTDEIKETEE